MKQICVFFLSAIAAFSADFVTGQAARLVIGQPTFTSEQQGADQGLVGGVSGLAYLNDMLFVADSNRVAANPEIIVPGVGHIHDTLIFAEVDGRWLINESHEGDPVYLAP